ncbi:MAG: polysaccharide pyruvyl transferase family protein [Paracoccaceae bacterium]|nr:polysaccharide pyruvyl transferase family protein [Paracoccaceae bacterium]
MKLTYFEGTPPNFGDALNAWIWDALLPPGFLDDDPDVLFLGIGSIIQSVYPQKARKVVVGSGFAGAYSSLPDVRDGSWDIRFVRGPETCRHLGIDPALAITDAAVLLRALKVPAPSPGIGVAFIPHYESVERGNWATVCDLAGVRFIDPTRPSREVLADIRGAGLLICEAMHGAIVADAMRTPWIGVETMHHVHRAKWFDWAASLGIDYRPARLRPSNGREFWAYHTGRWGSGPRARAVFESPAFRPVDTAILHAAAKSLARLAKSEPQLSDAQALERATERALAALDRLVADYAPRARASRA